MRCDIHNHTRYSNLRLRDALPTPKQLIDKAIDLGLNGIAITDHEALSAHPKANMYAQEIQEKYPDFKVMLGNEIYLVNERPSDKHYHFILIAKDKIGHYQLRRLSSLAWLNSYSAKGLTRVDTLKSDLEMIVRENPGHLIASSACLGGEISSSILELTAAEKIKNFEVAQSAHNQIVTLILWCKELFGDDFYLEVQPGISNEQKIANQRMLSIAQCFNLKIIPTSDSHYLEGQRYVHKAFLNSEEKEREVDAFYQDAYLHSTEEMIEKFKMSNYDELFIQQMFLNTMEIYDKVENYSLLHSQQIPEVEVEVYPTKEFSALDKINDYPMLKELFGSNNDIERYWINRCWEALENKFQDSPFNHQEYLKELEEEAEVKRVVGNRLDTNMFSYPVALAHYIDLFWECGSTVGAGRGSACSALNHYLLGITQLDPLQWNFPFFRYMNRETTGLGDIDLDLCPSKIPTIINKIKEERGSKFNSSLNLTDIEKKNLGAVYVCTFGTESSKSAIQTACRGYRSEEFSDGIDSDTAQFLSSLIPSERGFVWSISDAYYGNKEKDRKVVTPIKNTIDQYEGLLEIALGIEGCISRRGRHASGVLFTGEDPYEFNAYMVTPKGEIVTQYDLHDAEACGSTKMDLLVTEIQDKIVQTLEFLKKDNLIESDLSLRELYNKYLHPDVLPLQDKEIWKNIQEVKILDLFQLDSDVGRQGTKKVKPDNIIELSTVNGLIRLMTAEKGSETYLDKYVRYKKDINEYYKDIDKYNLTSQELSALKPYLGDTLGIGISQEQLMKVLMDNQICGYSLAEANAARKIVSKKKMDKIPFFKEKVYETAKTKNLADYVWDYVVAPGLG
jgi:DNA polymerase-3 subunit alpha